MAWWSWCIIGTLLLGAELFAIDAQFYLMFIGLSAVIVGLVGLLGIELPSWLQWIAFAVLAVTLMVTIRRQLYVKLRSRPIGRVSGDVDQHIVIGQDLAPGRSCRIEYRGSGWTAVNIGEQVIPAGADARIDSIEGLTLHVRAL
jgi:hypothetical protein